MQRTTVTRFASVLLVVLSLAQDAAAADDGLGLKRGGNGKEVSISGVSSGAAMAVQYAVAHSRSIAGVGAIAGPGWGCADGSFAQALNDCMCGRQPLASRVEAARKLAASGAIDKLVADRPQALQRAYVFHSAADATVVGPSGKAGIDFLAAFMGKPPLADWGAAADDSDHAGHGIVSPDGNDACRLNGKETSYVRRCKQADNAGKLLHALYGQGAFDAGKRAGPVPDSEVWQFDQRPFISQVKAGTGNIASDDWYFGWPYSTARRQNLDLADTGYLYVPPACRAAASNCRVHVALHGCKQDAREFAIKAGYNNWAQHYRVIVVYPAVKPGAPVSEAACQMPPANAFADLMTAKPNPNGCWDWWGYLDGWGASKNRYLTKKSPQMQVLERMIAAATAPVP